MPVIPRVRKHNSIKGNTMKDKVVLASIIFGVCLIISSYLLSSGMKSLGTGISSAGSSLGNGFASVVAAVAKQNETVPLKN